MGKALELIASFIITGFYYLTLFVYLIVPFLSCQVMLSNIKSGAVRI